MLARAETPEDMLDAFGRVAYGNGTIAEALLVLRLDNGNKPLPGSIDWQTAPR